MHTTAVYEAAYGELITDGTAHVIADVGAGDSPFGPDYEQRGRIVYRLDAHYADHMPPCANERSIAAAIQHGLPLADGVVDRAVSAFLFQHLLAEDRGPALREMLRITKPGDGYVAIFPVFRPRVIEAVVNGGRFGLDVAIGYPGDEGELVQRKLGYPTLVLRNTTGLSTADESGRAPLDRLIDALDETQALQPRPTLGKLLRKMRMRRTGDTRFDTSGRG